MGRKDFNKGMEAGARPFEDKFRQTAQREKEWKETFEGKFDNIRETNEAILDEMESREKEKFYKLHTIVDIRDLEKGDRETLLSLLFTLGETQEEVTELQQLFLRSVKKYLENEEDKKPTKWSVLKDGDWSVVESIYGIDETKAIAQAVMEFLFLGYGSHEAYMEEYEDLFECFNLNKKGFGEIREQIDLICRGTGLQGLAEMYGYVPKENTGNVIGGVDSEERIGTNEQHGTHGKLEDFRIAEIINVVSGEVKTFENQKLIFANQIKVENAKLVFKNCDISIDEENSGNIYCLIDVKEGTVNFENCIIRSAKKQFINALKNTKLTINKSVIDGSYKIFEERYGESFVSVRHSQMKYMPDDCQDYLFKAGEIEIIDTVFEEKQDKRVPNYSSSISDSIFDANKVLRIDECKFYDFIELPFMRNTDVCNSIFINCCVKIGNGSHNAPYEYKEKGGIFKNCEFEDCVFAKPANDCRMRFDNTELKSCIGVLPSKYMKDVTLNGGFLIIRTKEKIELMGCRFSDWSYETCRDISDKDGHDPFWYVTHWSLISEEDRTVIAAGYGSKITDCQFENLDLGKLSLIGGFPYATSSYVISNCQFENIQTGRNGILKKELRHEKGGVFRTRTVTENTDMKVENCAGL